MSNQTNPVANPMDQILAELQALRAENQALKASGSKAKKDTTKLIDGLSCAVSEKGAISVYGLGRFPVTLYKHQFERLVGVIPMIQAFIVANQSKLTLKPTAVK